MDQSLQILLLTVHTCMLLSNCSKGKLGGETAELARRRPTSMLASAEMLAACLHTCVTPAQADAAVSNSIRGSS